MRNCQLCVFVVICFKILIFVTIDTTSVTEYNAKIRL